MVGFGFNDCHLSHRQKFFRTLWFTPLLVGHFAWFFFTKHDGPVITWSVVGVMVILCVVPAVYQFRMWRKGIARSDASS